ncbi:MAG: hypothetical protein IPH59_04685 [bacterium]|nr:hypothetical protein [bacterium]
MNEKGVLGILIIVLLCLTTAESIATTDCSRDYEFIGFTKCDRQVIWIGARIGGQCQSNGLLAIDVLGDSCSIRTFGFDYEMKPGFVKTALARFPGEPSSLKVELIDDWIPLDSTLSIRYPTARISFRLHGARFRFHVTTMPGHGQSMPDAAIDLAVDKGGELELISYDPNGLYLNYRFKEVFYFSESRLLLIFTNQPRIAYGLDQMHGYLLFRVTHQ